MLRFAASMLVLAAGAFMLACGGAATPANAPDGRVAPKITRAAGQFTRSSTMAESRREHSAVLLQDGRVLVVGGKQNKTFAVRPQIDKVEIWDPATGKWTPTGSMKRKRVRQSLTVLPDGRVLVAGGEGDANMAIRTTEIWDPATGEWAKAANMKIAREGMGSVLLRDGQVMVIGGVSDTFGPLDSVEIYDPDSDTWTKVAPMAVRRSRATATLLERRSGGGYRRRKTGPAI